MTEQLVDNKLCWVIIALALFCYQQLWLTYLSYQHENKDSPQIKIKREFTTILVNTLPLLGLLGTIIGLLECFAGMSSAGVNSELVSGGIATALLTTQLGLICAIPGWLLDAYVFNHIQCHSSCSMNNGK